MRPRSLVVAMAGVVAACGSDDWRRRRREAASSAGEFGTGLKLGHRRLDLGHGRRVRRALVRLERRRLPFEETDDHPAEYKADTRPIEGDAPQLGYMHYGNTDPFGVAVSKSIEADAEKAGMEVNVYNLKFPSRTEPAAQANVSVVKQDDVVVQANLDPTVLPEYFDILEGDGCIPSIQLFIPIDDHPGMGNNWPDVGETIGKYTAETATERGWKPEDTALVQCTDRDSGPTVNVMFEHVPKAMAAAGFEVPEDNVFDIVCGLTDTQSGYKRVTDWYTSHPDFKHVAFSAIDSIRMIGDGPRRQGAGQPARGLDPLRRRRRRGVAAARPQRRPGHVGRVLRREASASGSSRWSRTSWPATRCPSFVGTELIPLTKDTIDEYYPNG